MSNPYLGEIRMFAGGFAPTGWAFCNGQPLAIAEFDALFVLLGTIYGGDGEQTFNLPNLQSRVPVHQGGAMNLQLGNTLGTEEETLSTQQIPNHTHAVVASSAIAPEANPNNNILATLTAGDAYMSEFLPAQDALNANTIVPVGGSQPHENSQPYLAISYIISLYGIFPRFS
jgi:microcystin-dependent protein